MVSRRLVIRSELKGNQAEPDEPSGRAKRPFVWKLTAYATHQKPKFFFKIFVFSKIIHIFAIK